MLWIFTDWFRIHVKHISIIFYITYIIIEKFVLMTLEFAKQYK